MVSRARDGSAVGTGENPERKGEQHLPKGPRTSFLAHQEIPSLFPSRSAQERFAVLGACGGRWPGSEGRTEWPQAHGPRREGVKPGKERVKKLAARTDTFQSALLSISSP